MKSMDPSNPPKKNQRVRPFQVLAPVFDPMMLATSPEALTGTAALPAIDHQFRHCVVDRVARAP